MEFLNSLYLKVDFTNLGSKIVGMKTYILLPILLFCNFLIAQNDIFEAIRHGDSNPVQDILRYDASAANRINSIGYSPLMVAAYNGKKEIVSLLIAYGADVNFDTDNGDALMAAVFKGHSEIVEILLTNGADPNEVDVHGKTALLLSTINGNAEITELLMKFGADQNQKDEHGKSSLDYAKEKELTEILSIFQKYQ